MRVASPPGGANLNLQCMLCQGRAENSTLVLCQRESTCLQTPLTETLIRWASSRFSSHFACCSVAYVIVTLWKSYKTGFINHVLHLAIVCHISPFSAHVYKVAFLLPPALLPKRHRPVKLVRISRVAHNGSVLLFSFRIDPRSHPPFPRLTTADCVPS